jgi:hypothetical protein
LKTAISSFSYVSEKNKELEKKNIELEKENTELDQCVKELEETKELEEALELEEATSECHLEALETARQWRVKQSKEKDDNLEKASKKIEMLEKVVA